MGKLQIERRVMGMVRTNVYLAINQDTKECILIDPADDEMACQRWIEGLGVKPVAVLLTHGHFDHCKAAAELAERYQIPIGAGEAEEEVLQDPQKNLSIQFGTSFTVKADEFFRDKECRTIAGFSIQVLHTPGHTKGGVCYFLPEEGVLFSGDTLFCASIGRSDFPTGSSSALVRSVRSLVNTLPDSINVYPGHESETTIAYEKEHNPFL